mmetsp:Transcript_19087/g.44466  ORF Transcript_19087/g.44466 Transcript_19087/m.44466 type:complete len:313 (+) Transcript_19087:269-1207(+)
MVLLVIVDFLEESNTQLGLLQSKNVLKVVLLDLEFRGHGHGRIGHLKRVGDQECRVPSDRQRPGEPVIGIDLTTKLKPTRDVGGVKTADILAVWAHQISAGPDPLVGNLRNAPDIGSSVDAVNSNPVILVWKEIVPANGDRFTYIVRILVGVNVLTKLGMLCITPGSLCEISSPLVKVIGEAKSAFLEETKVSHHRPCSKGNATQTSTFLLLFTELAAILEAFCGCVGNLVNMILVELFYTYGFGLFQTHSSVIVTGNHSIVDELTKEAVIGGETFASRSWNDHPQNLNLVIHGDFLRSVLWAGEGSRIQLS